MAHFRDLKRRVRELLGISEAIRTTNGALFTPRSPASGASLRVEATSSAWTDSASLLDSDWRTPT